MRRDVGVEKEKYEKFGKEMLKEFKDKKLVDVAVGFFGRTFVLVFEGNVGLKIRNPENLEIVDVKTIKRIP